MRNVLMFWIYGLVFVGLSATSPSLADEIYAPMSADDVRSKVLIWTAEQSDADPVKQEALQKLWAETALLPTTEELFDRVINSFAVWHAGVADLVQAERANASLHADFWKEAPNGFFKANVGLYYGRLLVERRLYDEALDVLSQVDAHEVIDPAGLFFHRAVAAQGVLEIKPALAALDLLLKQTEDVPVRYSTVAMLMQADLQNLEEKSLDEIAKMMSDSERRLDLGRAGEKVQSVQERIIADLDEFIKKVEAQGGGGGGGGGQNNSNDSGSPADDSRVKGSTAPGETDPKKLSKEGRWGDLPEKEQAKAKNLINRNFPSHYRQAIETYFKKLANRPASGK